MADICLAHLVCEQNGLASFERFIDSYRSSPAGISHKLVIILKGFKVRDLVLYENLLNNIEQEICSLKMKNSTYNLISPPPKLLTMITSASSILSASFSMRTGC